MNLRKNVLILLGALVISGCASSIDVQTTPVPRTPLNIQNAPPLNLRSVEWIVVTPQNIDSVWQKLRDRNVDLVLFAVTDKGYEKLSLNLLDIRQFIDTQKQIIVKYREYYETTNPDQQK